MIFDKCDWLVKEFNSINFNNNYINNNNQPQDYIGINIRKEKDESYSIYFLYGKDY